MSGDLGGRLPVRAKMRASIARLAAPPSLVGGVADVTCGHALEGGILHLPGVGEDGGGVC